MNEETYQNFIFIDEDEDPYIPLDEAVEILYRGVAPEVADHILEQISKLDSRYREYEGDFFKGHEHPFLMAFSNKLNKIVLNEKALMMIWIICFAQYHAMEFARAVCHNDLEMIQAVYPEIDQNKIDAVIEAALELLMREGFDWFTWPENIPTREEMYLNNGKNDVDRAGRDLILFAIAFILLHELRHAIFFNENNKPKDPLEEERQCDLYAINTILGNIDIYLEKHKRSEKDTKESVSYKRSLGIFMAECFMITTHLFPVPSKILYSDGEKHPSDKERMMMFLHRLDRLLKPSNRFWSSGVIYFAYLCHKYKISFADSKERFIPRYLKTLICRVLNSFKP